LRETFSVPVHPGWISEKGAFSNHKPSFGFSDNWPEAVSKFPIRSGAWREPLKILDLESEFVIKCQNIKKTKGGGNG
jgi:hypothetical protein